MTTGVANLYVKMQWAVVPLDSRYERAVVPPDSRYVPLVMQDYCAVPCCLSMAMLRRGLPLLAQELLAFHLGLTLPPHKEGAERLFFDASAHRTGVEGGVQPHEASFHPNVALAQLGIPLRFQFVPVSALDADQLQNLVIELTAEDDDRDVLFHFDSSVLDAASSVPASVRGRTAVPGDGQHQQKHMCVLDRAPPRTCAPTAYRLVDPAVHAPKWREVDGAQLLRAMQALGDEQLGGLWLLHGRNNDESSDEDAYISPDPYPTPFPTNPSVTPSITRENSNYEDVAKQCSFLGLDRLDRCDGLRCDGLRCDGLGCDGLGCDGLESSESESEKFVEDLLSTGTFRLGFRVWGLRV